VARRSARSVIQSTNTDLAVTVEALAPPGSLP
jgi:hypothetical protein